MKTTCGLVFLFSTLLAHTFFLKEEVYPLPKIHKIPKIVHHIWVGDKQIPEGYKYFMSTWKQIHPEWEHMLWTDEDVDDFPWINKELFLRCTNPGMKSDIWRYEILYNYGGLYVDTDMECRRSFNPIHERLEFYAGLDSDVKFIATNCVIGAAPKSPVLKRMIDSLSKSNKVIDISTITPDSIQGLTGPGLLTTYAKNLKPFNADNRTLIFLKKYFQPIACNNNGISKTAQEDFDVEYTCFAIHHNGGSWFK